MDEMGYAELIDGAVTAEIANMSEEQLRAALCDIMPDLVKAKLRAVVAAQFESGKWNPVFSESGVNVSDAVKRLIAELLPDLVAAQWAAQLQFVVDNVRKTLLAPA